MQQINGIFQIASVTLLTLTSLTFIRYLRQGMHTWVGIGFTLSIICYLVLETEFVQESFICAVVLTGAICVPVFFWLMSKAIFDDHFKVTISVGLWFLLQILAHFSFYLGGLLKPANTIVDVLNILAQIISIGFVLAGLYTALRTKQADLIDSRLHFRNIFIVITAALIGTTLIVETTTVAVQVEIFLQVLQRAAMLGITTFFLLSNLEIRSGFFFREIPKQKPVSLSGNQFLEDKLMMLLNQQHIYRKEGLTIKELADLMEVQEHRLRKLINGQLGFKNFNDFLNKYRVTEAGEILADATQNQKTVLEIAYSLGYQSIGPFNKAFKEQKNTTPTAFRKTQNQ